MAITFNGYNVLNITIPHTNATAGDPVMVKADGTVSQAVANGKFMGICVGTNGDYASVQTQGYIELAYTGTTPTVGYNKLCSSGSHSVKVSTETDAREYLVLWSDSKSRTLGIIL